MDQIDLVLLILRVLALVQLLRESTELLRFAPRLPRDPRTSLAAQAGRSVKVIEGTTEPMAVEATAPPALEPPKPKNRLMLEADTAVGPRERKPRKRKVPSPPAA
jgi:hypothetical protein